MNRTTEKKPVSALNSTSNASRIAKSESRKLGFQRSQETHAFVRVPFQEAKVPIIRGVLNQFPAFPSGDGCITQAGQPSKFESRKASFLSQRSNLVRCQDAEMSTDCVMYCLLGFCVEKLKIAVWANMHGDACMNRDGIRTRSIRKGMVLPNRAELRMAAIQARLAAIKIPMR